MLWALCGRISNYGDNGPLGYVLSSCGSRSQDFCTFIKEELDLQNFPMSFLTKSLFQLNHNQIQKYIHSSTIIGGRTMFMMNCTY